MEFKEGRLESERVEEQNKQDRSAAEKELTDKVEDLKMTLQTQNEDHAHQLESLRKVHQEEISNLTKELGKVRS